MRTIRLSVLVLLFAAGLLGCDTTATQPERQVVVEAYLVGGAPLPKIRLTHSVDTDQSYTPAEDAVENARVEVRRLASDGDAPDTTAYAETKPGVYRPDTPSPPIVKPLTTYELSVRTGDGTSLTATTTVPDTISIVKTENERVVYQGSAQPRFTITPPRSAREGQAVLVLTTTSQLDFGRPESQLRRRLTPFYKDDYNLEEDDIKPLRTTSSGILNEANFTQDAAGRITTKLPWISVAFYGPNSAAVHVIDDNLYDMIRSQQAQAAGGQGNGLGPGEIPNVIEHVKGGTGIFGSYVRDSTSIFVQRPSGSQ
ncbi:MAG: DUF4249 family protein [Salinibacter sp.]